MTKIISAKKKLKFTLKPINYTLQIKFISNKLCVTILHKQAGRTRTGSTKTSEEKKLGS